MTVLFSCPNCKQTPEGNSGNLTGAIVQCPRCQQLQQTMHTVSSIPGHFTGGKNTINVQTGDDALILSSRGKRITEAHLFQSLFVVSWFAGMAYISFGVYQINHFSLMVLFPFWLVGFFSLCGLLNAFYERQTLSIHQHTLTLEKKTLFGKKRTRFNTSGIGAIEMASYKINPWSALVRPHFMWKPQWTTKEEITMPAIIKGNTKEFFFESADTEEQEWMIGYLNSKLKQN